MGDSSSTIDRVIHEPARLVLVAALAVVSEADFVYLLRETGLTKGNLASHMEKLESAGYVEIEKGYVERVPRTLYRLTRDGRKALHRYRRALFALLEDLP